MIPFTTLLLGQHDKAVAPIGILIDKAAAMHPRITGPLDQPYSWCLQGGHDGRRYVARKARQDDYAEGSNDTIYIGRVLLGIFRPDDPPNGRTCDHIEPEALDDYRMSNLRWATAKEQRANQRRCKMLKLQLELPLKEVA